MTTPLVLILDDEAMIGFDLATTLQGAGYAVSGPHANPDRALAAIESEPPAAALLDVNLGKGRTSEAVAEALAARGIPFAFLTGYVAVTQMIDERFAAVPRLSKPVAPDDVLRAVADMLAGAEAAAE